MSSTTPTTVSAAPASLRRSPATAWTAAGLSALVATVGAYGSIYFTGLEGWDAMGITFVATYVSICVFGVVCAVALARGSESGRLGLVAYGLFTVAFTIVKIVTIQEWEALAFGVVGAVVLTLALHRRTRSFTG